MEYKERCSALEQKVNSLQQIEREKMKIESVVLELQNVS